MAWYLKTGQAETLADLTAYELKRYLGELGDWDLADNTILGFFEVLRAFASWADREGYPIDPALLRVRAPKVAQKEVESAYLLKHILYDWDDEHAVAIFNSCRRAMAPGVSGLGMSDRRQSGLGRTRLIAASTRRSVGCQRGRPTWRSSTPS